jgi:hypothetical protein
MKNNSFSVLFILIIINVSYSAQLPIELIFQNRNYIINNYNHLNDGTSLSDSQTVPFRYLKSTKVHNFLDSSFSCWKKNEVMVISEFIGSYIPKANMFYKYQYYIQDSITISILISLLDYFDYRPKPLLKDSTSVATWQYLTDIQKPAPNWVRDALWILTYKTYFCSLSKHSDQIIEHLKECKEPESEKLKLLVLCNLPVSILKTKRDSITNAHIKFKALFDKLQQDTNSLNQDSLKLVVTALTENEEIPYWVKARLGDDKAKNSIEKGLIRNDVDVHGILDYAVAASFYWSDYSKINFLKLFDRDMPICSPDEKYKICKSLQDTLLVLLARHHPNEEIFSNSLSFYRFNADYCKPAAQTPYFVKFTNWMKKKYNVEITYKGFTPYFKKDFSVEQSAIKNFCK